MSQFIRLSSPQGIIARFNSDLLLTYFPHKHSDGGCDAAGLSPCTSQTDLLFSGAAHILSAVESPEEIDRLINPSHTPG